jgi:hypothetical protein
VSTAHQALHNTGHDSAEGGARVAARARRPMQTAPVGGIVD